MKGFKRHLDRLRPQFEPGGRWKKLHSVFDGVYAFLYTPNVTSTAGVHVHDANDSKRTMMLVVLALLPSLLFGFYNIGFQHNLACGLTCGFWETFLYGAARALPQIVVAYVVGLGIEFTAAQIRGRDVQDGFLVTGLLIPMICPIDTPLWMLAVAVAFAVIFAKEAFGGTGYNIFNIALIARAFLFFAYPAAMSGDQVFVSLGGSAAVDGFSGATPLGQISSALHPADVQLTDAVGNPLSTLDCFLGFMPGSWGETSTLCILIGAAILLISGVGSWRIMLSGVAGAVLMACIAWVSASPLCPAAYLSPLQQLCVGGFAFAIVFMATDPVTACRTRSGQCVYGFLIGLLTIVIRCYGLGYPEGAMSAVLIMNAFASLIDRCVVRVNINRRLRRLNAMQR